MSNPSTTSAEMQQRFDSLAVDLRQSQETPDGAHFAHARYVPLLEYVLRVLCPYIRTLEKDNAELKKMLNILEFESEKIPNEITAHYILKAIKQTRESLAIK